MPLNPVEPASEWFGEVEVGANLNCLYDQGLQFSLSTAIIDRNRMEEHGASERLPPESRGKQSERYGVVSERVLEHK